MSRYQKWQQLGWKHPVWELVRFYCSIKSRKERKEWQKTLEEQCHINVDEKILPIPEEIVDQLLEYLTERSGWYKAMENYLRTEEEALSFCEKNNIAVGKTRTRSKDHHQSSKSLVAAVTGIVDKVCTKKELSFNPNPQTRCIWCHERKLHVTARNLDGAIPGLGNPDIIWEIKEYWGKTKGGSKMSDAVYECQLVGRELREFEEESGIKVKHFVFVDGKVQWSHRKSDLLRFIDLANQGLIDQLFIGKDVETEFEKILKENL